VIIRGLPFDIEGMQDSKSDSYAKRVAEYTGVEYKDYKSSGIKL